MTSTRIRHLVSRFAEMGVPVTTETEDLAFASSVLTATERGLWMMMDERDRRHSVAVTRRFVAKCPGALREEVAAALLHDVGKSQVTLGRVGRSIATIAPLSPAMRRYRDHERLGAEMLRGIGAHTRTIELVEGKATDAVAAALRAADDE
jgi:putative nucleotidyltransferase with HDIG domain